MTMDPEAHPLETRTGLPDALRILFHDYPRECWAEDLGFSALIRFWLDRHLMFRKVVGVLAEESEAALDGQSDMLSYSSRLSRYAGFFVDELHAHHTIEDHEYFPKLKVLDGRIAWGFDLLDRDHHAIDGHLDAFVAEAKNLLQAVASKSKADKELDIFHKRILMTAGFLDRHLTDEEELIVPVLLKYTPSGFG